MTKQKSPSFQFYYRDWLHGTRRLTDEEKVQYLEMLCEQADQPNGSIPDDIFNSECTSEKIRAKFEQDANGWFNVRQRDVLLKRDKFKESRLANLQSKSQVEPHMEPHVEKEKEKGKGNKKMEVVKKEPEPPLVFPFTDELFLNRWEVWKQYKKEQFRFTFKSNKSEQAALKQIGELSHGDVKVAVAIIQQSMANGWRGLFELKQNGNTPSTPAEAAEYYSRLKNAMK